MRNQMLNELEALLAKLKPILQEELELEQRQKIIETRKTAIADKLAHVMKTDTHATDFATIAKREAYDIEVIDEAQARPYFVPTEKLDKDMVTLAYQTLGAVPGISVTPRIQILIKKKKSGLASV